MAGSLTGSNAVSSATVNLSSPAQTDWIQFPQSATSPNRKSGGGSTIGLPTAIGTDASIGTGSGDIARGVTWTGGTPTASGTGDLEYIFAPNASGTANTGDGMQFTLPADTTSRTATIVWSNYSGTSGSAGAAAKLVATLSDGSASALTLSPAAPAVNANSYYVSTLTYNAASAGQTLTVAISLTTNATNQWSNVTLQAASYLTATSSNSATVTGALGSLATSASATRSGTATGASSLGALSASASASQSSSATASSALGALATQTTAVVTALAVAASALGGLASSGVATQSQSLTASSSLSLSTSASASQSQSASGVSTLGALSTGITATNNGSATAVVSSTLGALGTSATATRASSATGSSSLSLSTIATATQSRSGTAASTLGALSTSITATGIPNGTAIVVSTLGGLLSSVQATQSQSGVASSALTLLASASVTQKQAASGVSSLGALSSYAVVQPPYTATVSGVLGALSTSVVATFGAASYPVSPGFYWRYAPRSFYCASASRLFYASIAYQNLYAKQPARPFYAASIHRNFYVRLNPMLNTTPSFNVLDPRETVVLTFDGTALLNGATFTGTPALTFTTLIAGGSTTTPTFSNVIINSQPITVGGVSIAAGCAVQVTATGGAFAAEYLVAVECSASNGMTWVMKAELPMAPQ